MTTRDRIAEPWGVRTPYAPGEPWAVRVDTHLADGVRPEQVGLWVQSASILHSNGDALDIAVVGDRIVGVRGREVDRVNHGRLGPKDLFGWQANSSPDWLTRPLVREGGKLVESDWDTAMGRIVARSKELLDEQGPARLASTHGAAVPRGVLHARRDRPRRDRHQPRRRQHPPCTAAAALKESFASDRQPGSYTDIDHVDLRHLHRTAAGVSLDWELLA